tara:strand:- start:4194 stop:4505 length:312 start_codon:yes stop_codon:yes gene_type:complete
MVFIPDEIIETVQAYHNPLIEEHLERRATVRRWGCYFLLYNLFLFTLPFWISLGIPTPLAYLIWFAVGWFYYLFCFSVMVAYGITRHEPDFSIDGVVEMIIHE